MQFPEDKNPPNEIELGQSTARSQDSLNNSQDSEPQVPTKKHEKKYIQAGVGLATVVGLVYILYHHYISPTLAPDVLLNSEYKFQMYCPINKITFPLPAEIQVIRQFQDATNELRFLTQQALAKRTSNIDQYIIYYQMRRVSQNTNDSLLFFCSYVVSWDEPNCSKAVPVCTMPGPILYAERNRPIQVAWVYNIKNDDGQKKFRVNYGPCMSNLTFNQSKYKNYCTLNQRKKGYETCTYNQPTNLVPNHTHTKTFLMSPANIPVVTHIHGMEVRPVLDGNPMAWMGKQGQIGTAFQSLLGGEKYFDNGFFKNPMKTNFLPMQTMTHIYTKVNIYSNTQPPGDLWYHDHAMHITQDNVGHGLLGNYIIFQDSVDKQLPAREYDRFIVAGHHMSKSTFTADHTIPLIYHQLATNPNIPFFTQIDKVFMRNQTYRIRILNGYFDAVFMNLRFKTECTVVPGQAIDPKTCRKTLKFSVIGSDSALFSTPVHNVTKITLSSAERFELLIIFDGNMGALRQNEISSHAKEILLVDGNDNIKTKFTLLPKTGISNKYNRLPSQLMQIKGINFYDLTRITQLCSTTKVTNPTLCISTIRMKPIFKKSGAHFFNGHYDYQKSGKTDTPKIGTTEDWVFISLTHRHPIHIHLINFQIIGSTTLKNYTVNISNQNEPFYCTFYEMDYWVSVGLFPPSDNYTDLCIKAKSIDIKDEKTQAFLDGIYPEDTPNKDNASVIGFDVFKEVANESQRVRYNTQASCHNNYKYICGPVTNKHIPEQYRRWKDVALLNNHTVLVLRMRWASTDYLTNNGPDYPYFDTPEDQLIEYPGYVYHCHFLQHEDNKLMRPFQMQPSDKFDQMYNMNGTALGDCMQKRGLKNAEGWSSRFPCMNELSGCPST